MQSASNMKALNETATRIFSDLLGKLNNQGYVKLTSEVFMPLSMELLQTGITTSYGKANLYSLMHTYVQEGDLMRDPEVCFLVVDNRIDSKDYNNLRVFPISYRQDNLGMDDESVRIEDDEVTNLIPVWQHEHCVFANQWMKNIKEQEFLA
ncbi:MAG: hypothetical protein E6Q24_07065 [Chitinophagaceae bacterium]|nr:MAG: hypothetical protein E6Q24_07065 [Chitinophagaceae bacterium]